MNNSFNLKDLENAFNAGKDYPEFDAWVRTQNEGIQVFDSPDSLVNKFIILGGVTRKSVYRIISIDLTSINRDVIDKFLKDEFFEEKGYIQGTNYVKYVSPKYKGGIYVQYDRSWKFINICY